MDRIERAAQAICLARFGHLRGYRKHKSIADQYRREAEAAIRAAGGIPTPEAPVGDGYFPY